MTAFFSTLIAQKTDLGSFEPPSKPFGFGLGSSSSAGQGAADTFEKIFSIGLGAVTLIAGLYFLAVFVMAAFNWLSAGGDAGKVEKARDSMVNGLIGLTIIVASYAIMGVLGTLFGLNILRPGELFLELAP